MVTDQVLEARLDALRYELVAQMAELRGDLVATMERGFRAQTWRLVGAMFVAFGLFATLALRELTPAGEIIVVAKHAHQKELALELGATVARGPLVGAVSSVPR